MMKRFKILNIAIIIALVVSNAIALPILLTNDTLANPDGSFPFGSYFKWIITLFILVMLGLLVSISHKLATGKVQELLFVFSSILLNSFVFAYLLFTVIHCSFNFTKIDWLGSFDTLLIDFRFYLVLMLSFGVFFGVYVMVINKEFLSFFGTNKLKQVKNSNLENSRWMTKPEMRSIFKPYYYSQLNEVKKDGIPVLAKLDVREKDMEVLFSNPSHALVIGATGSGKTTTFVSPMIQLLAATSAESSMIITDPKGELFSLHSKYLKERGYDVKVIDLRNTYSSYRWNPLDNIWDAYQEYNEIYKKPVRHTDDITKTTLKLDQEVKEPDKLEEWYEYEGKAFIDFDRMMNSLKISRKKIYDEVYEDLNDLVSVLIPVENDNDPLWEKGARSITLAVLLAMLEDSENPANGMTKEKFNFFNMTKILQNSNKDYESLRLYFKGRSSLSKAYSLSKQVCDSAPTTRASYMSIVYDKLTLFNDAGVCSLTSASDFNTHNLVDHKTALFLKIPDEKDTRHNLAAIFILDIYKTLIKIASAREDLALPRNVYFIMDEFGNMPRISKFDKFITVGRSRKIWFTMIVQSYAQLNNVYGDTVADIIKGNCGVKMFIGSNDMATCKEFSELCGNITIQSTTTSNQGKGEKNTSVSLQTRPLIYPSDLQRLNRPGDIGHSVIVTFGNYPLKAYFTPSFKVPLYHVGMMEQYDLEERYFNEKEIYYNIKKRNKRVLDKDEAHDMAEDAKYMTPTDVEEDKENLETNNDEIGKEDIFQLYEELKKDNPNLSFQGFCQMVANGEISLDKEASHGKKTK